MGAIRVRWGKEIFMKKVLFSSVFKPYGVDDAYGRKENIMELFHNQITREQGLFSLRFHHQSFGLHLLAENVSIPATVLDFPSEQRFIKELKNGYDYIGITFIIPNFVKAKHMCNLIREHSPTSKIILGGQGTRIPDIEKLIEHDYLCRGEGVKWLRELLGDDLEQPFRHPAVPSAISKQIFGVPLKTDTAVLIPGVGCPNGCRFCCTSHFFDKQYIPYIDSGDALFETCREIEEKLGFDEFFVIDENFLKQTKRAQRLVELMEQHDKPYRFGIFSSADTIKEIGVKFLARMGVYTVWLGVESKYEIHEKNKDIDLKQMIEELRDHGINVLASGILFLEHHDPKTIQEDIDFMIDLEPDLLQIMQLAPLPGTPLYKQYDQQEVLMKDIPFEEWHGQRQIWFKHPHFTPEQSEQILRDAFNQDYNVNGSSLLRMSDTAIRGYEKLKQYNESCMQKRSETLRQWVESFRPALPVLLKYAHNDTSKKLARRVIAQYDNVLGPVSFRQKMRGYVALACAAVSVFNMRNRPAVRQPRTIMTKYRM